MRNLLSLSRWRGGAPVLSYLAACGGLLLALGGEAWADPRPELQAQAGSVSSSERAAESRALMFSVDTITAEAGGDVPLGISIPSSDDLKLADAQSGSFILVRKVPNGVSLSEGMPIGKNWIMSLSQGKTARLLSTSQSTGEHRLEFLLIGPGNRVLAETEMIASLHPPGTVNNLPTSTPKEEIKRLWQAPPSPAPEPILQVRPPVDRLPADEEDILMVRGAELVGQGGMAAARLIFEELANRGSIQGALALARSYDPAFVASAPSASLMKPDVPLALKWYERAAELGSTEAQERISQLGRGG